MARTQREPGPVTCCPLPAARPLWLDVAVFLSHITCQGWLCQTLGEKTLMPSRPVRLKLKRALVTWRFVKAQTGGTQPRLSDSVGQGRGPRIDISYKLPGDKGHRVHENTQNHSSSRPKARHRAGEREVREDPPGVESSSPAHSAVSAPASSAPLACVENRSCSSLAAADDSSSRAQSPPQSLCWVVKHLTGDHQPRPGSPKRGVGGISRPFWYHSRGKLAWSRGKSTAAILPYLCPPSLGSSRSQLPGESSLSECPPPSQPTTCCVPWSPSVMRVRSMNKLRGSKVLGLSCPLHPAR